MFKLYEWLFNPRHRPYLALFVFLASLGVLFVHYRYNRIIHLKPQSTHQWRQTDCTSLALNYYQDGNSFLKPTIHNQLNRAGEAAGEFPILYYTIAQLYKVFGPHEIIFRLFNTLLFFLGLFALFRTVSIVLKDHFWGIFTALLLFTSPLVVYYACNFLPDVPALSLSLVGWLFFTRFYFKQSDKWLYWSMLFFMLAGLVKITAAMSFIAIGSVFVLELMGVKFKAEGKIFSFNWRQILPFLLVVIAVALWYFFVLDFNKTYHNSYFSTRTWPIWDLDQKGLNHVVLMLDLHWRIQPFAPITTFGFMILLGVNILFWKRQNPLITTLLWVLFLGVIMYVLLWFAAFNHHDYYLINLFILPVVLLVNSLVIIRKVAPKAFASIWVKLGFLLFLLYNISYAKDQIKRRYWGDMNHTRHSPLFGMDEYMDEIDIPKDAKVLSVFDPSPNVSLYLMNRKGWTNLNGFLSESRIEEYIDRGAQYLVVSDTNRRNMYYLKPFTLEENLKGVYNKSVSVFKIEKRKYE